MFSFFFSGTREFGRGGGAARVGAAVCDPNVFARRCAKPPKMNFIYTDG